MKITWVGHSCFKVEDKGYTVIFDPYGDNTVPGLNGIKESADLILCSHEHSDHGARDRVAQINGLKNPYTVTEIPTFHDNKKGTLRGKNIIHLLDNGIFRIAHFGDIGCELTGEQAELLSDLDVAMIPVGGYYTIDAQEAKQMVDRIHPKIVIPMHYRGEHFGFEVIGTVDKFTDLCRNVIRYDGCLLEINVGTEEQVAVLAPQNRRMEDMR